MNFIETVCASTIGTMCGIGALILVSHIVPLANAQDGAERQRAALPALVEQRNNAMDAAALCQGDLALLKQQFAAAQAEIEKLKAPPK